MEKRRPGRVHLQETVPGGGGGGGGGEEVGLGVNHKQLSHPYRLSDVMSVTHRKLEFLVVWSVASLTLNLLVSGLKLLNSQIC